MSGAQSWSVKGIDPKVREAAREAAARQGMSLGEYLNQALAGQRPTSDGGAPSQQQNSPLAARQRLSRALGADLEDEDDWSVASAPRGGDPARLVQRIESIERRTQLAVTGLDRAVSTIDRSVLGLAARVEDAEATSAEAADRIAEALEHFRAAGEMLSGKLERAESDVEQSKLAFEGAAESIVSVKERLEQQVAVAEEVARRAEAAAAYLTTEMGSREAALTQTLAEARSVAEQAARQASEASADAVAELKRLQEALSERLSESEISTRRAVENAIADVRTESASETRGTREALLEEVVRLESEIAKRVGVVDELKAEQTQLISRIERAEAGSRESTAGLRQAAGAAIADLRNAQLTLAARVKQVEDTAGMGGGGVDLTDLRQHQQDIAERLASLETKTASSPVTDALAAFERRLASVEAIGGGDAVHVLDDTLQRLAARMAETESSANTAIRTLEETVSALGARVEQSGAGQSTEAVRAMLEQRLDHMAQTVREELTSQFQTAMNGGEGVEQALADVNHRLAAAERRQAQTIEAISLEIKRMSETVDKRLRSVESRNDDAAGAAVREELARMTTTLEARFDEIERREAAAFDRMGLEVGRLSERLEERVGAVETRSAQAIEHVGEQVARMAERFNQRQDILARDLGERMLDSEERANQRVTEAIGSMMARLAEVEEHSAEAIAPVQKAVSSVASKLEQFENTHDTHDIDDAPTMAIPTPSRRYDDFPMFGELEENQADASPMDAAQPVRAAPLPPRASEPAPTHNDDIYFAEEIDDLLVDDDLGAELPPTFEAEPEFKAIELPPEDDLLIDDPLLDDVDAVAAPPQDDDPFWAPDDLMTEAPQTFTDVPLAAAAAHEATDVPLQGAPLDLDVAEPPLPPGKNDYLANARKAAQAQVQTNAKPAKAPKPGKTKKAKDENAAAEAPKLSLRGPSRIILWGTASLIAVALIGGAKYFGSQREAAPVAEPPPAEPPAAPQVQAVDPNAVAPGEDPFAQAPVEGPAPIVGTPGAAPTATPPIAQNNAAPGTQVVAGPLAPRNVSLEQAATTGDLTAQYELGLQRLAAGRSQDGVTLLRRAADRGFAMAQYRLAKLYERGEGVSADLVVARQWTERAAAAGNRRAMHDLGVYFARGEGAPLDEAAAFRWFRQAAELGVADSQYNLGVLYQQGRGVNASASEAMFWFLVAARQGDQDAGARATSLEAQLAPAQVEQARTRAQSFRPRAASAVANGEFGNRAWARAGT